MLKDWIRTYAICAASDDTVQASELGSIVGRVEVDRAGDV